MTWRRVALWIGAGSAGLLLLAAGAGAVWAQAAGPHPNTQAVGAITDSYRLASEVWLARLAPIAQRLFVVLAGIEVALSGLLYGFRRHQMDELASRFVLKFGLLSFLFALITSFPLWVPKLVAGFAAAGELATGAPGTINPSDVIDLGISIAGNILSLFSFAGILRDPGTVIVGAICALVVLFAYMLIAGQLILVLVESYIVLTGGVIFLGFAAFRGTAWLAEGYLAYAVSVSVRIFLLYLMASVGTTISQTWIAQLQGPPDLLTGGAKELHVIGGVVIFAMLISIIPKEIAARITSHSSFGIVHALRML